MQIRVLDSVGVELNDRPVKLGGPKQRAVLAMLALNANTTVSVERLIDGLWGEDPPATGAKMVQQYVSQLRRLLDDDDGGLIVTRGRGYELHVDPATVDGLRFERLVELAADEGAGRRSELAREALDLWRGLPLAGMLDEPFAASEVRRFEELHLAAIELDIEGELEAGRHAEIIGRLAALVDEHPLRERLRALLMLALYRAGRQAEALNTYRDARWTLVETLGLEPGPELRRLQEAILRQDPSLELVVPDEAWASRETVTQVDAGAGQASRRRRELRAIEHELAANVIDLQTLRERTGRRGRRPVGRVCPFKGLEPFDVADAELFFGRERLVSEIVARLPGRSLVGVVGPSGSGKSSAVRAGLLPALAAGVLPGSERWTRVVVRPGQRPLATLARALAAQDADPLASALARVQTGSRLVVVVDQFEEVFTTAERRAASRVHGRARPRRRAAPHRAGDPRRLLRTMRGAPPAGAAPRREPRARRADAAGRACARDRGAGGRGGACRRAGAGRSPRRRDGRRDRRAAAAVDDPGRAVGTTVRRPDDDARVRAHRRRARGGRPACGDRLREARRRGSPDGAQHAAATRGCRRGRGGGAPARAARRAGPGAQGIRRPCARCPDAVPARDGWRRDGRGRARSPAARMAAPARLARARRRGAAAAPSHHAGGT